MRVVEFMFGQGYANGKLEYSSIIVSMYILQEDEGNVPLKSMLSRSIGWVALIRLPGMQR